jgi:hypothetical protein
VNDAASDVWKIILSRSSVLFLTIKIFCVNSTFVIVHVGEYSTGGLFYVD